jgi:cell division cycle 14
VRQLPRKDQNRKVQCHPWQRCSVVLQRQVMDRLSSTSKVCSLPFQHFQTGLFLLPHSTVSSSLRLHRRQNDALIMHCKDRLYLASYTHPPSETTPFPYHSRASTSSPQKRSSKSHSSSGPKAHPPVYFTIDDTLIYNRFYADFGPLHIGHLYRFAVHLHEILADPENADRGVVFWSKADSRSRANAACLLACYMVLVQHWPPHLALAPIAQADPPLMPFRDAGYSQADYGLSVQDVVYGVWKAKEEGLTGVKDFSLEEYVGGRECSGRDSILTVTQI